MAIKHFKPHEKFLLKNEKVWDDFTVTHDDNPEIIRYTALLAKTIEDKLKLTGAPELTGQIITEAIAGTKIKDDEWLCLVIAILIDCWKHGDDLWLWQISESKRCYRCNTPRTCPVLNNCYIKRKKLKKEVIL